jgi:HSP20 family molecular chaperone IbpA
MVGKETSRPSKGKETRVENGVLTVTLPAQTEPQPVTIAIESGSESQA